VRRSRGASDAALRSATRPPIEASRGRRRRGAAAFVEAERVVGIQEQANGAELVTGVPMSTGA
jgi:hypothetical protein